MSNDQPMKLRVQRAIRSLAEDKLIVQPRKGARWELTEKGEKLPEYQPGVAEKPYHHVVSGTNWYLTDTERRDGVIQIEIRNENKKLR